MNQEMLANRYLLNGKDEKAIELYRRSLADNDNSSARCRLIAAYFKNGDYENTATELSQLIDKEGIEGLSCLTGNCKGYIKHNSDNELVSELADGLCRILHGNWKEATSQLLEIDLAKYPAVNQLANQLQAAQTLETPDSKSNRT